MTMNMGNLGSGDHDITFSVCAKARSYPTRSPRSAIAATTPIFTGAMEGRHRPDLRPAYSSAQAVLSMPHHKVEDQCEDGDGIDQRLRVRAPVGTEHVHPHLRAFLHGPGAARHAGAHQDELRGFIRPDRWLTGSAGGGTGGGGPQHDGHKGKQQLHRGTADTAVQRFHRADMGNQDGRHVGPKAPWGANRLGPCVTLAKPGAGAQAFPCVLSGRCAPFFM
jgi:hypothetical protein